MPHGGVFWSDPEVDTTGVSDYDSEKDQRNLHRALQPIDLSGDSVAEWEHQMTEGEKEWRYGKREAQINKRDYYVKKRKALAEGKEWRPWETAQNIARRIYFVHKMRYEKATGKPYHVKEPQPVEEEDEKTDQNHTKRRVYRPKPRQVQQRRQLSEEEVETQGKIPSLSTAQL